MGRLYLRVVHRGESRSVTTEHQILPEEWDAAKRRLIIPYDHSARSRELIEIERSLLGDLQLMGRIIDRLEWGCRGGCGTGGYSIDSLMDRYRYLASGNTVCAYTERLASGLEHDGYRRTARAYRTTAVRLRAFNNGLDPKPEQLTAEYLTAFQQSLRAEGCNQNTASFYMRTLRAIYNKAVAEGRIAASTFDNPFAGVYTGTSPTRKRALSQTDLATLATLDPTLTEDRTSDMVAVQPLPEPLGQALAMFLFCYHARGMCFVDMANLKKADLRGNTIRYRRAKTGQTIELKVLPAMRRIIEWFAPRTVGSRYLFPVITDSAKDPSLQYESGLRIQNIRLKRIAARCGITVCVSTHCARHSWATVARNAGLSLAVISEGLGHTHQRTTEIYLASLERSVIDHASRLVSDAIICGTNLVSTTKTVRARP